MSSMTFFIDRPETDKFLSKLTEGLKDPVNNPLVLHSWGIGGVGKTTLLAKIVEQHPEAAIAKVSFGLTSDIETPIKLMKKLHEQLYPNLNDWEDNEDEFTRRYNEYQITLSKLEKDKDAKEFGKILQSSAQGILVAEKAASEVTKQGIQALMESTGVTDKLNAWLNRIPATKGNVELQKLIKEPLPVLTKAFAASLRAKAEQQPVLLLFDTYEKGIPEIDRWLWHWLLANNELKDVAVRLVITGRNEILKQEGWRKLQQDRGFIYSKGVERFNPGLTKVYLWQIGVRQEEYFDRIYRITKGWPYYLNIIRQQLMDGQNIESILSQIDRGIEELLLQESDIDKKRLMSQVSRTAACCQSFDRGLIKYLLAKLELSPTMDGRDCYDWLTEQHFFEQERSRLDDVAREVFRKFLWREDRELFLQVHGCLADYFMTKSARYASPDSSYPDKYENDDWLTARSEYLYHRLFADRVDTKEFIGYLLESLYFRENKLVQVPLQGILAESDLDQHPFLSAQARQFLIKVKPAITNTWAVLEESPIDYSYNERRYNISKSETDEAIGVCLDMNEQTTKLAEFMRLYCKSKRCTESDRFDWLMRAKQQFEQFMIDSEPAEFVCDLLLTKVAESLYEIEKHDDEIDVYNWILNNNHYSNKVRVWWLRGTTLGIIQRYEESIESLNKCVEMDSTYWAGWKTLGIVLKEVKRYAEAIVAYDRVIEIKPDDYEPYFKKADILDDLGRYDEAIATYDLALVMKPEEDEIWRYRGISLRKSGKIEEAIASYDKSLELNPDSHEALHCKGYALGELSRYEEAIIAYDRAIAIEPDKHESLENKASNLCSLDKYEEAIAAYDRALEIKPDKHETWNGRGIALRRSGKIEEAIASYDKSLELNPDSHEALHCKGYALGELSRYEDAIITYDQALAIKPDKHESLENKASALCKLNRYEEAIAAYDRALEIKPYKYEIWSDRGVALANLGRFEESITLYDQALSIKPDSHEALFNKGAALANLGRFEESITFYDQALAIKPALHVSLIGKGAALANLGRYDESIAAFDLAIDIKPDSHEAFYNKGSALANLGRYDESIAAFDLAIDIRPDSHEAFYNKGSALSCLGRYEEAIVAYDRAIDIKPDKHEAFYNKSCAFALSEESELAINSLHTAINLEPENRESAKNDPDFDVIRNNDKFQQLISEPNTQT